ncbi:45 kDa antigen, partial [Taenia solium]
KINDGTTLPKSFYWSRVGPTVLSLCWNTGSLAKLRGGQIEFSLTRPPNHTAEQSITAEFSDGEVTLGSLVPDSLYLALLTVNWERDYTFKHLDLAMTLRSGEKERTFPCGGSALSSAIAGIVFTSMVLALA